MTDDRALASLRDLPARTRDVIRTVGLARTLRVAPGWGLRQRFEALECRLEEEEGLGPDVALPAGVEVRELEVAGIARLCAANPVLAESEAERRLAEGVRCLLFERGGSLVHYRWYATGPAFLPFARLRWEPAAGDYLSLEAHTVDRARGGGLNSRLVAWSTGHARGLGCRRKIAFVANWNTPSLTATTRHGGFTPVGSLSALRLGPWRRVTASGRVEVADGRVSIPPRAAGAAQCQESKSSTDR